MKVLCLCSYPVESAATRYRLLQFISPLADRGIELTVRPFFSSRAFETFYNSGKTLQKSLDIFASTMRRSADTLKVKNYDAVLVQREAMFLGPPIFEWLMTKMGGRPLVLDLDDATYIRYVSPTYGRIGSALKFFGKTDYLIKSSALVVCGNRFIAEYVENLGGKSAIVPTVVNTNEFFPLEKDNSIPVIGWIGTHSTFLFLKKILPTLEKLAQNYQFTLKIVGAGDAAAKKADFTNLKVEWLEWKLEREIADFQSLDIGLYPISITDSANEQWLLGKSGFKAIQYMSVGVPFVVTPVGICAELGENGKTHFSAKSEEEWSENLSLLLDNCQLRQNMGAAGRQYALKHFTVEKQADKLKDALFRAVKSTPLSKARF